MENDTKVVGQGASGKGAIAKVEALQPEVVLIDIQMPSVDGIKATRQTVTTGPDTGLDY